MRYTDDQKKDFVQSWEQSNKSRKQYSKSESLCYASFLTWTKKYGKEIDAGGKKSRGNFIKLKGSFGGSRILLPNGVVIEINQTITAELIKMLGCVV